MSSPTRALIEKNSPLYGVLSNEVADYSFEFKDEAKRKANPT